MGRKLLKTVQTITTFRNPLADPVGTRRGPPLLRGPQFENRCHRPSSRLPLLSVKPAVTSIAFTRWRYL